MKYLSLQNLCTMTVPQYLCPFGLYKNERAPRKMQKKKAEMLGSRSHIQHTSYKHLKIDSATTA